MSYTTDFSWPEANQRHLMQAIAEVRQEIEASLDSRNGERKNTEHSRSTAEQSAPSKTPDAQEALPIQPPSAIESLCSIFHLSSFERKVLLLCAGVEMDSSLSDLVTRIHRDDRRRQPSFGLALGMFSDAHWSALSPARPLRYWHMIEVVPGESLTGASLSMQERVLHYLAGVQYLDERLRHQFRQLPPRKDLCLPMRPWLKTLPPFGMRRVSMVRFRSTRVR